MEKSRRFDVSVVRVRKDGKAKVYDAMPIYTYTDPATGRQKSKRIPKDAFDRVRELTGKYKGMRKLIARFEAAAVAENLDGGSKCCCSTGQWRQLQNYGRDVPVASKEVGNVLILTRRDVASTMEARFCNCLSDYA